MTERASASKRFMLTLLCIMTFLYSIGETLSAPVIPILADTLGVAYARIGFLTVSYSVGYCLCTLVAGTLSDRYGRRPVVIVMLMVWVFASLGYCFANNFVVLFASKFMEGASRGASWPLCSAILGDNVTEENRNRVTGRYTMCYASGSIAGYVTGGMLTQFISLRAPLFIFPVSSVIMLGMMLALFKDTKPHRKPEHHAVSASFGQRAKDASGELKKFVPLFIVAAAYVGFIICSAGMFSIMANKLSVSAIGISALFSVFWCCRLVLFFFFDKIAARFNYRKIIITGLCFVTTATLFYILGKTLPVLLIGVISGGIGTGLVYPSVVGVITRDGAAQKQGLIMGFWEFCGSVGAFIQSALSGILGQYMGVQYTFLSTFVFFVLSVLIVLKFKISPRE